MKSQVNSEKNVEETHSTCMGPGNDRNPENKQFQLKNHVFSLPRVAMVECASVMTGMGAIKQGPAGLAGELK